MSLTSITKAGATMEDLATGVGKVQQQRSGKSYNLGMIDVPYAVLDLAALKALDVNKFGYAKYNNTFYRYDDQDDTGIRPDAGNGSWLVEEVSNNVRDTASKLALDPLTTLLGAEIYPTEPRDAVVSDEIPAGTSAIRLEGRWYYLATPVTTKGTLTSYDVSQRLKKVTIDITDYSIELIDLRNINNMDEVGTPIYWPGDTAPAWALAFEGQPFDKAAFPVLAQRYPTGVLPDLRKDYIRGLDTSNGESALDRQTESVQPLSFVGDVLPNHYHPFSDGYMAYYSSHNQNSAGHQPGPGMAPKDRNRNTSSKSAGTPTGTIDGTGTETRPRSVLFLIITRAA